MSYTTSDRLGHKLAIGAIWMIGARFTARSIGLVSTIVLARLLLPADFGVVALAMMVVAMLQVMTEFGFDMALIQNQEATRRHYDTVWTLSLVRGAFTALMMLAIAQPVATFFDEPRLVEVMQVLALAPLLMQSINPATANFRKHFNFHREFLLMILPKLVSFTVTVALAVAWASYWALIVGILLQHLLRLLASYLLDGFRPRLCVSEWRDVMNFSKWLLVSTVMTLLRKRMSALVIGRLAGLHMLGVFQVAHEISNLPTSELIAPIKRALYPGYARMGKDPELMGASFLNAFGLICLLAIPLSIGVNLTSDHLVYTLLGPNWVDAIPFMEVLALAGMLATCRGHARPIYLALNRPAIGAYLTIAETALLALSIFVFYKLMGTIGVAWAAVVVEAFMTVCDIILLRRLLGVRLRSWLAEFWRPATAGAIMTAAVIQLDAQIPVSDTTFDHARALVACAVVGLFVYLAAIALLWSLAARTGLTAERNLMWFIADMMRRTRKRPGMRPAPSAPAD